jgi:hypothetical protein
MSTDNWSLRATELAGGCIRTANNKAAGNPRTTLYRIDSIPRRQPRADLKTTTSDHHFVIWCKRRAGSRNRAAFLVLSARMEFAIGSYGPGDVPA